MSFGRYFDGKGGLRLQPGNILPSMRGISSVTVFAKVRLAPNIIDGQRAILELASSASPGLFLGINGGFLQVGARSQPSDSYVSNLSAYRLKNGEWSSVIGVIDYASGTIRVGLDGELGAPVSVFFGATSLSPAVKPVGFDQIGVGVDGVNRPFTGDIGDVAIWSRSLTQAEFSQLHYQGIRPDQLVGTPPVSYWPLNEQGQADPYTSGSVGISSHLIPQSSSPFPEVTEFLPVTDPEFRFKGARVLRISGDLASVSRSDGTPVGDVRVKGIGVKALQSTVANRPDYKIISGKKAIQFVAANSDYMQAAIGDIDTTKGVSVIALMNNRNSGRVFSLSSSASIETNGLFFQAVTGLATTDNTPVASYSTYSDYTNGSVALFSGRFSSQETVNWLNGVKRNGNVTNGSERSDGSFKPTNVPTPSAHLQLQLGRRLHSSSPSYWDGDLYDLIIVEGSLTDEEIRYLEGVVAWQNSRVDLLPVGHPFKSSEPILDSPIEFVWGSTSSVVSRSKSPPTLYAGGPGLIRANDTLFCCYDYFGSHAEQGNSFLSVSEDDGLTWTVRSSFPDTIWPTVWQHTDGNLYLFSLSSSSGNIEVRKSTDFGFSWTSPASLCGTGLPLPSPVAGDAPPNYHRASGLQPLYYDGHLFFACENIDPFSLNSGFKPFVLYVEESSDLIVPTNWKASNQVSRGTLPFVDPDFGTLEGSVVVDDFGQINLVYRGTGNYGSANVNKGVIWPVTWTGSIATVTSWSPSHIKDVPGGQAKIPVFKYDGYIYSISNQNVDVSQFQRNRSVLIRTPSNDLDAWSVHQVLVDQDQVELKTGMTESNSRAYHSFQYSGFFIEDGYIYAAYRVAWSGADSWHNTNYVGFSRFTLSV